MTTNLIDNLKLVAKMAVESNDGLAALKEFERYIIEAQLRKRKWNQSETAIHLRIGRSTLTRRMGEYGIVIPEEFRGEYPQRKAA